MSEKIARALERLLRKLEWSATTGLPLGSRVITQFVPSCPICGARKPPVGSDEASPHSPECELDDLIYALSNR